jgi:uncharacterized protein (DUF1330 family)
MSTDHEKTTDARPGALDELRSDVPADGPIALVNLLRFAETAEIDGDRMTGEQAYERYVHAIMPALVGAGGRPIFRGRGRTILIGPGYERWDEIAIVVYPTRAAFERLALSEEYRSNAAIRLAALEDARLIALTAPQRIGRIAGFLFALSVKLRRD